MSSCTTCRRLCCILLLLFHLDLQAQQADKIDSLKQVLADTDVDTTRLKMYGLLSWYLARSSETIGEARSYTDSLNLLSKRIGNLPGMGYSYIRYGHIEKIMGNYPQSLSYLDSALGYYVPLGDSSQVADILFDYGGIHRSMGNYELSLPYFYRVLEISRAEGNLTAVASTLTSIGITHRLIGQFDAAIASYTEALGILEKLDNPTRLATCLNGLGTVYSDLENYPAAREYYKKALEINEKLGNDRETAYQLSNLGHVENKLGAFEKALAYYQRALEIREKIPRKEDLALGYRNVGDAYLKLNQLAQAESYLQKGLAISKEIQTVPISRDIYQMLKEIYEKRQDYKTALGFQELYIAAKDSVVNEESKKQLASIQTKFETERKEKEIVLLKQENALQVAALRREAMVKKATLTGIGMLVALLLLVGYIFRQRLRNQHTLESKNKEIQEVNHRRQLSELEMKALQAQINPHFIFNCLNSINQMILNGENESASMYLAKFGRLIRMILENAESTEVSLKDELLLLESYIQLESLRFSGKINHSISYKNEIDPENTYLPSMILQPFVENAIWHGLLNRPDYHEGLISISFEQKEDELICQIEDNGIGREKAFELRKSTIWKSKSMGLKLTEERLKLMSTALKQQLVKISDLTDKAGEALGTQVTITIPMN